MSSLFTTLLTSAGAMRVFESSLSTIQHNVSNSSTPGYAKQGLDLIALPYQPGTGLPGGVAAGDLISFRSEYAEQAVRRQAELFGKFSQKSSGLEPIEPIFAIGENAGIPASMSALFQAFSTLAVAPNNTASRQVVIDRAADLAAGFNQAARGLAGVSIDAQGQVRDLVSRIDGLAEDIRDINQQRRRNAATNQDAGIDARLHAALEDLAELADITTLPQEDGSVTVLLAGQTPLVIGEHSFPISADFSTPKALIHDASGEDITAHVQEGRLAAALELKNSLIPEYAAGLDRLAQEFADRFNSALGQGVDAGGEKPALDLFSYDPAGGAALTLRVTAIAPQDIAAASADAPGSNGNALAIAQLASSGQIDGFTFSEFYGNLAAQVGRDVAAARDDQRTEEQLLSQARSLRQQIAGVDLNEEAARLIEFQRAYQASARLISVLDDLADTVINLLK